jgi:diamine N-acetyltransferase
MEIQVATLTDIPTIKKLAWDIWPAAYGAILSDEQLTYMLELIYSEEALQKQFKTQTFLLAYHNEEPIGYASYQQYEQKLKLHKIYVLPNTQGKGYGKQLLHYVMQTAISLKCNTLYLNVNKYNKALQFYQKQGFTIIAEEVIDIGSGYVMDDFVLSYALGVMNDKL